MLSIFADTTPVPQRCAMLAIDNSDASLTGIVAPVAAGWLIVAAPARPGARSARPLH